VSLGPVPLGDGAPLVLIAGPCVIESESHALDIARELVRIAAASGVPLIFKASFDKANRVRSSHARARPGAGTARARQGEAGDGPARADRHSRVDQAGPAGAVVDVLQIGVSLAADGLDRGRRETGRAVNIKKGQFLAPATCATPSRR
jgi:2-dehydro-3-deoxyphosphooctonate aldolase (KDO 8-P synthase)